MIWHPHTDAPGDAENALIARCDDLGELFLVCIAERARDEWIEEQFGIPVPPPFWWADERDLLGMIER